MHFPAAAHRLRTHAALFLAGAAITLSFAPFRFWWIAPLACAALALALARCSPREAFYRGWSFGGGLFLGGASWIYVSIHDHGFVPAPIAAVLTGAFCIGLGLVHAVTAWLYANRIRDGRAGDLLGFAALWTAGEWVRGWLLTGFPWLYLGYAHLETPLRGWAPVGGVLAIGFIVSFAGAALAAFARDPKRWTPLAAAAAFALLGQSLATQEWTHRSGDAVRVSLVQANIPQEQKWRPENLGPTLERYRDMTLPLLAESDVVIWPEAAIPAFFHHAEDFLEPLARRAEENGTTFITGIPYWRPGHIYNAVVALGAGDGVYFKRHLVPFGEYVPLDEWLGELIDIFRLPLSNFSAGEASQAPLLAAGHRLATFVCYEIVYHDLVARGARKADLLLTVSNDAWFGRSIGPAQHMQMAQMRALENGRYLIRGTGTGITALVDQRGRITARLPQHERGVLTGEVYPFAGQTPFTRAGSLPILTLCALLLAIAAWRRSRA